MASWTRTRSSGVVVGFFVERRFREGILGRKRGFMGRRKTGRADSES